MKPTLLLLVLLPLQGSAQQDHPINGVAAPAREHLVSIPAEEWTGLHGEQLPAQVDLRPFLPPPGDQGKQSSCIAFALAYGMKSMQETRETAARAGTNARVPVKVMSPAFVYNLTRAINYSTDTDCSGSYFTHTFSVLYEYGCCPWEEMPYDTARLACISTVNETAKKSALQHRISMPFRVEPKNRDQLRHHLALGDPVAFSMQIDTAFKYGGKRAGQQGLPFPCPSPATEGPHGLHAMLLVGYSDADSTYLAMNSWGTSWGEGGFFRITYTEFATRAMEAFVAPDDWDGKSFTAPGTVRKEQPDPDGAVTAKLRARSILHVHGMEMHLVRMARDRGRVLLAVRDSVGHGVEWLDLREDRPMRIQRGDHLVTVTFDGASRSLPQLQMRTHLVVQVEEDRTDPDVERILKLVEEMRLPEE
jgi:hypothetical protein